MHALESSLWIKPIHKGLQWALIKLWSDVRLTVGLSGWQWAGEVLRGRFPHPSHTLLDCDGCTNCGLMKENPANSAWSMLAMTSSSGGVSCGWVRVKNLSKFSAPLPHCRKERQKREKFRHEVCKIIRRVQADRLDRTDKSGSTGRSVRMAVLRRQETLSRVWF